MVSGDRARLTGNGGNSWDTQEAEQKGFPLGTVIYDRGEIMQQSDVTDRAASNGSRHAANFAELMVQGSARMFEIQTAAARTFCQYQAKSAAMLGAPDWSQVFKGNGHARFFASTAEDVLHYMRQTSETIAEIQSDMCHLVEGQTAELSDQLRQGLKQTGALMSEGLEESKRMTEQAAERAAQEGKRAKHA